MLLYVIAHAAPPAFLGVNHHKQDSASERQSTGHCEPCPRATRCICRLSRSAPSASRRLGGPWPRRMARRGGVTRRSTRVRRRLEGTPPTVRGDDTALYTPWRDSLRSSTPDSDTAARAAAHRRVAVRSKKPRGTAVTRQDRGRNTHWRVTW